MRPDDYIELSACGGERCLIESNLLRKVADRHVAVVDVGGVEGNSESATARKLLGEFGGEPQETCTREFCEHECFIVGKLEHDEERLIWQHPFDVELKLTRKLVILVSFFSQKKYHASETFRSIGQARKSIPEG